jgi:hypothetical protein
MPENIDRDSSGGIAWSPGQGNNGDGVQLALSVALFAACSVNLILLASGCSSGSLVRAPHVNISIAGWFAIERRRILAR